MKTSSKLNSIQLNSKVPLRSYKLRQAIIPWLFLAPGILITLLLRYYNIFQGLKLSFYRYVLINPPGDFVGLNNFKFMFKNTNYWEAWQNTLYFVVLIIVLQFFVPVIQALFLAEIVKLKGLFSTIYILPAVIPLTINIVLWRWIFDPTYGIANYILSLFGGAPQLWLSDTALVKFCIIIPGIIGGGIAVLLYLAAILGISEDIKEASQLDGCSGLKRMFYITLPNIKFLILIQLVLTTIGAFQMFDLPLQFTGGGPGNSATSIALYIYRTSVINFDYGTASAGATTLMVVIAIITFIQLKLSKEEKE